MISTALQQRAQFTVLRGMSEYQPPLTITQQGYRGIARVQIAQLKTQDERKWAELKSTSWPPWKVDRTAMDSDIGPEHGISRAVHKFESWRNGTTELLRQTLKVLDNAGVELDAEGFKIVCFSFGFRALIRRDQTMAQHTEESRKVVWAHQLQHNENDSWFLRALFSKVVGLGDGTHFKPHITAASGRESAATPTVLSVPSAVVLHSYIRALGIMGDYEGLLSIASFMHDNVAGLLHHCDNELNGHVRLRRTVVALRCFLERSWDNQLKQLSWPPTEEHELDALDELDQRADQGTIMKAEPAPEELIVLVRDKVEDLAATWGHWPSDGELQEYVDWIEVRHM
ncbi:hypothetical protein SLS55_004276 [Diplodia seriata]|uniref:Uncharacterized protein n=1 Tax=Diplodia seriata TaxID=420778 RepID=A0ABR3CLP3_9PEZI